MSNLPNHNTEGTNGQSELRRRNGPSSGAPEDGDADQAKADGMGLISRVFRRIWNVIGSLFRRLFCWTTA